VAGSDIQTYSDLSAVAAQGKKLAKEIPGSSYVRDGKIVLGKSQTGGAGVGGTARIKKDAAPPEL
jgi:hypothetical protein